MTTRRQLRTDLTLEGSVVRLEPLRLLHLDALCAVGLDPELWKVTIANVQTRDDMRSYIEAALHAREQGTALPFVIVERKSATVIGSTRYLNIDLPNRKVEIGSTWVARRWQRTAVNTEAKYLVLRYAFEELECVRVEFKTDLLNAQSRSALLRIGAKEEGILRKHQIHAERTRAGYGLLQRHRYGVAGGEKTARGEIEESC
jgi:RimJ/RimL family protein N-acetyltransferase